MELGFIIFLVVGVMAAALIFGHLQAKKRREMLASWANASGLKFEARKQRNFDDAFPVPCFRRGGSRYAYNLCSGERSGYAVVAGDYHYVTGSGKNKQTHTFSFFLFQPAFPLRNFALRPEHVFDKLSAAFGFDDIDFESAAFSKAFHVKCEDRKWAYDALHPRTMELLLRQHDIQLQADGRGLVVMNGKIWQIPQFEHYASAVVQFLDAIPNHAKELG
jgi:hypothetical protein